MLGVVCVYSLMAITTEPPPDHLNGVELIYEERLRQMSEKGWSADHDATWTDGQLCRAATCYIKGASNRYWTPSQLAWPWDFKWWKPTTRIRMLVKAGALIAAEIDRLLRDGERP